MCVWPRATVLLEATTATEFGAPFTERGVRYGVPRCTVLAAPGAGAAPASQEAETATSRAPSSAGRAATVERSARVAEGDVRRIVRRLQCRACTVERSACVAEGDVRRSVRRSQRRACTVERSANLVEGDVRYSVPRRAVLAAAPWHAVVAHGLTA